jgi:putative mRNA 3-end processing factor
VEEEFLSKVEDVIDRGGTAIIPAFAVGRTQEVIQVLSRLDEEMWLDGMGRRVSQIYLKHPECIRDPRGLKKALGNMNFVKTPLQREKALEAPIVITTSGMLDGGPVMNYLMRRKDDRKSAVLLTGYQVHDTNGRMLVDTGAIELDGELNQVRCEVCQFDFSAHAGHDELIRFAEGSGAEEVILVHGDQREEMVNELSGFAKVMLPKDGDIHRY